MRCTGSFKRLCKNNNLKLNECINIELLNQIELENIYVNFSGFFI